MFVLTELVNDTEDWESPYVKLVGVYDRLEDAQHVMVRMYCDALYREIGDECDDEGIGFIYDDSARIDGEFVTFAYDIFDTNKIQ